MSHTLYRMFDGEGGLLCIGLTDDPVRRVKSHGSTKLWWGKVDSITLEHFGSRADLKVAERSAIRSESPLYNVAHNAANSELRMDAEYYDEEDYEDELIGQALKRLAVDAANGCSPSEMVRLYALYLNEAKKDSP